MQGMRPLLRMVTSVSFGQRLGPGIRVASEGGFPYPVFRPTEYKTEASILHTDPPSSTMAVKDIRVIHTLGPAGTNCEAAAHEWFRRNGRKGTVHLHPTFEIAAQALNDDPAIAVLGCVAYPDLHNLVFSNLNRFQMVDVFVMPTFNMILASRTGEAPRTISTHPAPQQLAPPARSCASSTAMRRPPWNAGTAARTAASPRPRRPIRWGSRRFRTSGRCRWVSRSTRRCEAGQRQRTDAA